MSTTRITLTIETVTPTEGGGGATTVTTHGATTDTRAALAALQMDLVPLAARTLGHLDADQAAEREAAITQANVWGEHAAQRDAMHAAGWDVPESGGMASVWRGFVDALAEGRVPTGGAQAVTVDLDAAGETLREDDALEDDGDAPALAHVAAHARPMTTSAPACPACTGTGTAHGERCFQAHQAHQA